MFTINLEKELINQKASLVTPEELLYIKEYEKLEKLNIDTSVYERLGIETVKQGKGKKIGMDQLKKDTLKFDQSRVFHISQIKETCDKYYLRFLPSCLYKGAVDDQLPLKIQTFETAHRVRLDGGEKRLRRFTYGIAVDDCNAFIMAPASSFKLQERPKDPLLFYKINKEYYYLIHKWGNDLSIANRIKGLWHSTTPVALLYILFIVFTIIWFALIGDGSQHTTFAKISFSVACSLITSLLVTLFIIMPGLIKPNEYDSHLS